MKTKSITQKRVAARKRRVKHIRKHLSGTPERPRLRVFRSLKHIYAQVIDDESGRTLADMSTLRTEFAERVTPEMKPVQKSFLVGQILGEVAIKNGVRKVAFDRGGFLFHGRVKALADGARKAGLEF